jgi:GNAT superfamily N-acetyltransferase
LLDPYIYMIATQPPQATLRQAVRADVREIQRVRRAVRENRLVSMVITDDEVIAAIEQTGQGWVVEDDGRIVAFSIGNAVNGNIWALFVESGYEGRGHGRRLHDAMVNWLWSRGLKRLWLTTEQKTRAQRFYELAGWQNSGMQPSGEILFEKQAP